MNKDLYKKLKQEIAIDNFENESPTECKEIERNARKKKILTIMTGITITIFGTGAVVACNIENITKYFRGLGIGIDSAIESGYIENPDMNFVSSGENSNSNQSISSENFSVKIEDFMMDDFYLSTQFTIKCGEQIDLNNIDEIKLSNLIVLDEQNRIIYNDCDKESFEKFCKERNLQYVYGQESENYYNCGLNKFVNNINQTEKTVNVIYNMYSDKNFPKSKKLNYNFDKIIFVEKNSNKKIISGNWNMNVNIPEKMYNRQKEYYKVTNCNSDNVKVYSASLSDTGFEIGLVISGIKRPNISLKDIMKEKNFDEMSKEEYNELKDKYKEYTYLTEPIAISEESKNGKSSYIQNELGKKFECTLSPNRNVKKEWLDENTYNFYETFGMTKYNSTDKIEVVLYCYDSIIKINLEKI